MMTSDKTTTPPPGDQLPKAKQTSLGLYVTSQEAYTMWKNEPESVHIIDVRTPEEYVFIGHPEMAVNIPIGYVEQKWDAKGDDFVLAPNPDFVERVKSSYSAGDTLLVMCRSGNRSAVSANFLAKAGFTNVYNITDGMEGDKVKDTDSAFHGKRMLNGWKNSGSPWTYEIDLELLRLPAA